MRAWMATAGYDLLRPSPTKTQSYLGRWRRDRWDARGLTANNDHEVTQYHVVVLKASGTRSWQSPKKEKGLRQQTALL